MAIRHSLDPIFRPRSVAVVGASATPGSVGSILIRNLLENPFGGVVYPVNPKRHAVHGVLCYPDLGALPEAVDLAVIATPAPTVPGLIEGCVRRGIPAAIVISAGFSELGAEGRALEAKIKEAARGRMRIVGPNCLGVIHPPSNLNASFAAAMAAPGKVALLSQSGAICTAILDWAREARIGFSSFVSVGAMLDVDFADLIDYFADDPTTPGGRVALPPAPRDGGGGVRAGGRRRLAAPGTGTASAGAPHRHRPRARREAPGRAGAGGEWADAGVDAQAGLHGGADGGCDGDCGEPGPGWPHTGDRVQISALPGRQRTREPRLTP
jgi:predicted CoA-binding protein